MKQPDKNSQGMMRVNYNNLIHIATCKEEVIEETTIVSLKSASGIIQEVFAGDCKFFPMFRKAAMILLLMAAGLQVNAQSWVESYSHWSYEIDEHLTEYDDNISILYFKDSLVVSTGRTVQSWEVILVDGIIAFKSDSGELWQQVHYIEPQRTVLRNMEYLEEYIFYQ